MTPEALKQWRLSLQSERGRRRVSKREAADRLGVGYRTYCRWEEEGTDRLVALACSALLHQIPPYGG